MPPAVERYRLPRQILPDPFGPVPLPLPNPGLPVPPPASLTRTRSPEPDAATATRTRTRPILTTADSDVITSRSKPTATRTEKTTTILLASSSSSVSTPSLSSALSSTEPTVSTTPVAVPAATSLIYINSFPADFPVETVTFASSHDAGRGYAILQGNEAGDSMLLFLTFFLSTLVLSLLFLRLTRYLDERKARLGQKGKEDQMVSDEMRWAEGREIVDRRIVRDAKVDMGEMECVAGVAVGGARRNRDETGLRRGW